MTKPRRFVALITPLLNVHRVAVASAFTGLVELVPVWGNPRMRGHPVGTHLGRVDVVLECVSEESASGGQIPLLGHKDVDDLTKLSDHAAPVLKLFKIPGFLT